MPPSPAVDRAARGEGAGKLILFGEHAVVWGAQAVATSLPRGAEATATPRRQGAEPGSRLSLYDASRRQLAALKLPPQADEEAPTLERAVGAILDQFELTSPGLDLEVTFHLPPGVNLGSSAAMAFALARAIAKSTGALNAPERVERAVLASEQIFHGDASGVDQAAASSHGVIAFRRGETSRTLPLGAPLHLVVCLAEPGAPTAEMVASVTARRAAFPEAFEPLRGLCEALSREAERALARGDLERLGELMDMNHGALVTMGVSTAALDRACHRARALGALGAKLTGGGGGGCVVALAPTGQDAERLARSLRADYQDAFTASIPASCDPFTR